MFKVTFLLSIFWIGAVICQDCQFIDQTWGDKNPVMITYCDLKTNTPELTNCRSGTGYKNNDTVSGCVDWKDWNEGCILRHRISNIVSCGGGNSVSPHPVLDDPTSFFLCSSSIAEPVVLPCPAGRGFVSHKGYKGCVPWESWRDITGCTY